MGDKSNQEEKNIPASRGLVPRLNFFSKEGLMTFLAIVLIVVILFGIIFVLNGFSFDITF
ncbi:MAG: hypothetical protein Q4Q19_07055 [Methanobrevibacter sp.]|nr:hypothetical protein [Methanobrevibacter sp.]